MSNGWDLVSGNGNNANQNKAEFTVFPEGITRIRVIDEAPFMRWTHWWADAQRSINCPGKGCPICAIRHAQKANKQPYTIGMARRFAINVINRDAKRVEIMEQGVGFFEELLNIRSDMDEANKKPIDEDTNPRHFPNLLLGTDLKIRRRGKGQDNTSYRIDPDVTAPLSKEDLKLAENRTNLEEYFKPHEIDKITRLINGEKWVDVFSSKQADAETEETNAGGDEEVGLE